MKSDVGYDSFQHMKLEILTEFVQSTFDVKKLTSINKTH